MRFLRGSLWNLLLLYRGQADLAVVVPGLLLIPVLRLLTLLTRGLGGVMESLSGDGLISYEIGVRSIDLNALRGALAVAGDVAGVLGEDLVALVGRRFGHLGAFN